MEHTPGILPVQSVQSNGKYTFAQPKDQSQILYYLQFISLLGWGVVSCLGYLLICSLGDLRQKVPEFLFYYLLLGMIYLVSFKIAAVQGIGSKFLNLTNHADLDAIPQGKALSAVDLTEDAGTPPKKNRLKAAKIEKPGILKLIIFFAVLFRAIMFLSPPSLSDDVYRYVWEGSIQIEGFNPYRVAPQSEILKNYRNTTWERVNNKDVPAIYPPLMQIFNALTFFLFRSVWGFKLIFIALDFWILRTLFLLLQANQKNPLQIIVYAWNPLIVVEIAGSGHHDVLVVALLLQSLWFYQRNLHERSLLNLGASILCKWYPLVTVPLYLRKVPLRKFWVLPLILLTGCLPYLLAGPDLFNALWHYRQKWRFNGFLYQSLSSLLHSEADAEAILLLVVLSTLAASLYCRKSLLEQCYWMVGMILICSPNLFPWYVVWIVPFLCFFPNPAWLLLTSTIALSYSVLIDWWTLGVWQQNQALLILEFLPFYGMMLWVFVGKLHSRRV
jgi:alpha-1,6-mannosyltransferase